jgi:hypothetical protein
MSPQADIERDLARLADGSLEPARARELEARVAESPELGALLQEQRRSLELTRSLSDEAPLHLRERVEALRRESRPAPRARRFGLAGGLVTTAAIAAAVVVAVVGSGTAGPTLSEAAAFTLKAPAGPPPAHSFDGALDLSVDGVPYPYWQKSLGWKAVGRRVDKVSGRTATTVFYRKGKLRVGYTIVTGKPVSVSGKPSVTFHDGIRYRSLPIHGTTVVTWERRDHSCILSGRGLSRPQLLKLASWRDAGELPYMG